MRSKYGTAVLAVFEKPLVIHPNWPDLQYGALLHNYRKTHLFGAAERINYTFGYAEGTEDPFRVPLVAGFPVGVLNCYEAEFPELSRILALRGAKLIVIPTAADYDYTLPDGRRTQVPYPDVTHTLIPAHAYENVCFIAYCKAWKG